MKKIILMAIVLLSSLSAEWNVNIKINPVDDTKIVELSLKSNNDGKMFIECKEGKINIMLITAYMNFMDFNPEILTRIGKEKAIQVSEKSSLFKKNPKKFLDKLLADNTNTFVIRGKAGDASIFDTKGLDKAIIPLKEACKW